MRICFYAAVKDRELFELVEFYRQDIEILRSLGHEVRCANSPLELRGGWDLAWVWWQTSGTPAVLAARLRRRPAVLVTALSDNDHSDSGMAAKSRPVRLLAHIGLASATIVLPTSEDTARGLTGYRIRHVRTVPLSIDAARFSPGGPGPAADPTVLTISHLTSDNLTRKRLIDVVHTAAHLPEAKVLIVGRFGDGAPALRGEIDRLGLQDRVSLLGSVSPEEKLRLLRSAHVYLQPTRYEAFGVAIAEAMACGVPVVSSAVGHVPDLVGDTGTLLPARAGPKEFATAVRSALARGTAPGAAGRERILTHYSTEARREVMAELLSAAVTPGRRGPADRPRSGLR